MSHTLTGLYKRQHQIKSTSFEVSTAKEGGGILRADLKTDREVARLMCVLTSFISKHS